MEKVLEELTIFYIYLVTIVALFTLILTPFLISFSKYVNFLDYPSNRKIHRFPTPLVGGLILALITVIFSKLLIHNLFVNKIVFFSILIFILGFIDDYFNLNPFVKLSGQILIVFIFLNKIEHIYLINFFENYYINFFITLFWMLFVINAINLIDGVDGLAAGLSFLLFTSVASISIQNHYIDLLTFSLIFASSLIIFLRFNISPAKVFLGDSGSLYLGFVISAVSLFVYSKTLISYSFLVPVMFLLIPLLDVVRVAFKRVKTGKNIFQADKEHIHHKLLEYGFSDRQVLLLLYSLTCFISIITLKNYGNSLKIVFLTILIILFILFLLIKIFQLFNLKKIVKYLNYKIRRKIRSLVKGSIDKKSKSVIICNAVILIVIFYFYLMFILNENWNFQKSMVFIIIGIIILANQLFMYFDDTGKIFSNFLMFWIYFYLSYILNVRCPYVLNTISITLAIVVFYKGIIKKQFDLFLYNPLEILIVHTIIILLFAIPGLNFLLVAKTFIIYYSTKGFFEKGSKEYKIFIPLIAIMIFIAPFYNLLNLAKK